MKQFLKRFFLATYLSRKWRARCYRRQTRAAVFAEIHRTNAWGSAESVSGPGSELRQTSAIRQLLPDLLRRLDVHTFLDIPCGDFHWMREVELGSVRYIGADIVPALIDDNQMRYGGNSREFVVRDITCDALPAADFVMCRDCLMHLGFTEIQAALRTLCGTCARYLLITTYANTRRNADIGHGGWWPMNLQCAPFNLPPPLELFPENPADTESQSLRKSMALWKCEDIARALANRGM